MTPEPRSYHDVKRLAGEVYEEEEEQKKREEKFDDFLFGLAFLAWISS